MDFIERTRDLNTEDLLARNAFFTTKVVMQTLQPSLESSVQRNSTMTPLKAANHLWLNENQVHFPLQQLK